MDSIQQAYMSMFNNNNKSQTKNNENQNDQSIEIILQQLNSHIRYFINILPQQQQKILRLSLLQSYPFTFNCLDNIRFKFQLNFGTSSFIFYCIPATSLKFLTKKCKPLLQFYGGSISDPDSGKLIILPGVGVTKLPERKFLVFKSLPLKKSYLKNRKKLFLNLNNNQVGLIKPKEQSINDVLLQYMGYFRRR